MEEHELLTFFEVEPTLAHADTPWPYNDYLYEIQQGDVSLSCAIAPFHKDIRIILRMTSCKLYELNNMGGVKDIRYQNKNSDETLEIIFDENDWIVLRVQPEIELFHNRKRTT